MVVKWVYQKALFFVRIVGRVGMFPNPIQYLKSKGRNHALARNVDPTRLHIKNAYYKNQRPQNRSSGVLSYQGCFDGQPVSRLKAASPGSFYTLQTPPFQ